MLKRNVCKVFDFDGTIALSGVVTIRNVNKLRKIENKVLNTSRSFDEVPDQAKMLFDNVMCLNGSQYYEGGVLKKEYSPFDSVQIKKIVELAITNGYNISFNSTTDNFQNVNDVESINFMVNKEMNFSGDILIPDKVFQVCLSHHSSVNENLFKVPGVNVFKQSPRFVEICLNNKGNISNICDEYIAYGDSENDVPMFKGAVHYFKVFDAFIEDSYW